jgi:thymidylate synthase (FAD)
VKIAPILVEYVDHCGNDNSVVRAARVSFAGDSKEFDEIKDSKLIKYLAKHKHTSPFNHTFITVRVKAPVFVARQLVKHKFMPINEVSRRYVSDEPEFYIPNIYRAKAENIKQGSSNVDVPTMWHHDAITGEPWPVVTENAVQLHTEACLKMYSDMLTANICPEQARMVLPQNMMTTWYWSGTLGAFADMLKLRLDSHTQKETQEVAQQIKVIVLPLFPIALQSLLDN